MLRWDLTVTHEGERVGPQVLFSTAEARGILVELAADEEMGDHRVRERAIVQVIHGSIALTSASDSATCGEGTLIVFEPGERHSVRALAPSRLLLVLAPWPGSEHYDEREGEDPHDLPAHATQPPLAGGS